MANVITLANIAALRTHAGGSATPAIWLDGYANPADGGEGMFTYVPTDTTSADNNGTIIVDASGHRYYRNSLDGSLNVAWFGGSPSSSNNATALNYALAALGSTGGEIVFAPGIWTFTAAVSFTYPSGAFSISFVGSGAANTVLYWVSSNGISLNASNAKHSFHFLDITLRAGSAGTSTGVTLTQSSPLGNCDQSDFTRVTFDGTTTSNFWANAISVVGWSFINFTGVLIYASGAGSTGVALLGNSAASPYMSGIVYNFVSCGFYGCGYGISYGSYVQGVTVNQCNFTNGSVGILVSSGVSGSLSQLTVSNCQFGVAATALDITGAINEVIVCNNLIIQQSGAVAINFTAASSFNTFTGNVFPSTSATGTIAILFNAAVTDSIVSIRRGPRRGRVTLRRLERRRFSIARGAARRAGKPDGRRCGAARRRAKPADRCR